MPRISPNPACYRVLGRADEIARTANSPHMRAEHLFLAIIHDKGMPAQVLARLADISQLEAAVTEAAGRAAAQPDERPSRPDLAGFRVAADMGDSYVGPGTFSSRSSETASRCPRAPWPAWLTPARWRPPSRMS